MKVLDSRFLRGPNIHDMRPCFVSLLDLANHQPVALEELLDGLAQLRLLVPDHHLPATLGATDVARLLARMTLAAQAWAGHPVAFCDAVSLAPAAPGQYRLVSGYQHEALAQQSLRLSIEFLVAALRNRTFDLKARLDTLRACVPHSTCCPATPGSTTASRPHERQHVPVVAITGTNGKTTTTLLIAHVLRASGLRTGATTTQGIFVDGRCVETGDCSGSGSARKVLNDSTVQVATLETARGGILKRGLGFDHCDVGIVLNISNDHLGLDGVDTLQDLAHVKGLVARCARVAAVLNADDALCLAMRDGLSPGCRPVLFSMAPTNPALLEHVRKGGAAAWLDAAGWLVWCADGHRSRVVKAVDLSFTLQGRARYNTANALAALAGLRCIGQPLIAIARALAGFVSDAHSNPMRGNQFDVDGVRLFVDYAHNVAAYRALCAAARSMIGGPARLLGVVTSPGDRRREDLYETGRVCGEGFDELVVYEHDPRGRDAGTTTEEILRGARSAAPAKTLLGRLGIRQALALGLAAARPGDVLVFTCAGTFDDLVEGVRMGHPTAAERIARSVGLTVDALETEAL